MHRLEALSVGKKFDCPEANEDSFVVIPGAGYAVIDGVTETARAMEICFREDSPHC